MGNRRMISKTITQTQRFLQLPLETQALYFHLIQHADDDGVVEAFPVVRMIGASDDSLGLLVVKQFIKPLNNEMVYFVVDFHEQNTVRKDRYSPSIYKHLLDEEALNINGLPSGNQPTTNGLPNISQSKSSQYNLSQSRSSQKEDDHKTKNVIFEKLKQAFGELSVNATMVTEVEDLLKTHGKELLIYALEVTILNAGKSIRYTRTVLSNWQGKGLRTVEQIKHNEQAYQKSNHQKQLEEIDPELGF